MICACIDIGSNTTRLLVADAGDGQLRELVTQRAFTRIGKSLASTGSIPAEKIAETAEVVATQANVAREVGAEQIVAVATAAIRNAPNRDALLTAVQEAGGMELEVLSGEEEARLSFVGATRTMLQPADGTIAVIDVGGGSSEIAVGEPDGHMAWSASFRIGSGFLADSYLRSDPPSVDELEKVRRHVAGTFEGLEPPPAREAVAVGGTATSLRRLLGAELSHETLERGIRVLCTTPIAEVAGALRARSRAGAPAAGRHPRAGGDLGPAGAAAADRARRAARGRAAGAGGGPAACLVRGCFSSRGRISTMSSPRSMPARPPFFMRTCAPVSEWTAAEKSGSWPTSSTSSPSPAASASASNGPPASFGSSCGSTSPSCSQAMRAVSAARTLGLVRQASISTPSAFSAAPAARDCSRPLSVSGRSASGEPSAASPWRNNQIIAMRHHRG